MTDSDQQAVEDFLQLKIHTPSFGHREHVEIAYRMLETSDFVTACTRYAQTIKAMAEQHGAPEKYNATITFAFMSLIAERRSQMRDTGLSHFLEGNPDLMEKDVLKRWYSDDRLTSAAARSQFLLPDKACTANA